MGREGALRPPHTSLSSHSSKVKSPTLLGPPGWVSGRTQDRPCRRGGEQGTATAGAPAAGPPHAPRPRPALRVPCPTVEAGGPGAFAKREACKSRAVSSDGPLPEGPATRLPAVGPQRPFCTVRRALPSPTPPSIVSVSLSPHPSQFGYCGSGWEGPTFLPVCAPQGEDDIALGVGWGSRAMTAAG